MDAIDGVLNATALRLPGHHGIEDMRLRQWGVGLSAIQLGVRYVTISDEIRQGGGENI